MKRGKSAPRIAAEGAGAAAKWAKMPLGGPLKMQCRKALAAMILAALAAASAGAATGSFYSSARPGEGSFFDKSGEGYWWYAREQEEAKKKNEGKKPKPVIQSPAPAPARETAKAEEKPPAPGTTEWISKNLDSYRKLAIDNPTVENLRAYLYMQRLALDRSEQFAYAGQMAAEGDPLLDEAARRPFGGSSLGTRQNVYMNAEQDRLVKRLYQRLGVFYVFKNRCFLCDEQARALKVAENDGLTISAVSIDQPEEGSVSAEIFPDYTVNPAIMQELKIRALPASFLFDPVKRDVKPLVQGMVTLSELNSRTIRAAKKYGWISDEEFKYVEPVEEVTSLSGIFSPQSDLSKRIAREGGLDPYGKDTNFIEPGRLVKMIREAKDLDIPANYVPRGY